MVTKSFCLNIVDKFYFMDGGHRNLTLFLADVGD